MAQAWHAPEGTVKLFFIFTVPDYTGLVVLGIAGALFVLAIFLALATYVSILQRWAIPAVGYFSPVLGLVSVTAFVLGWASAASNLPGDQWWSQLLILGGFVLTLFLLFRYLQQAYRAGTADHE